MGRRPKENPVLRPMSEHPKHDTVVRFHYLNSKGEKSTYFALWDGEWKCRKPYTEDGWGPMPNSEILGWDKPIPHEDYLNPKNAK